MNITVNGTAETLDGTLNVDAYLRERNILPKKVVVEKNGIILKSSDYQSEELSEGDSLEILTILGGG